jgi:dTDP-4-dehydrorhamnose reductase
VAGSVIEQAPPGWEINVLSRGEMPLRRADLHATRFDPRDTESLVALFSRVRPHAVVHTAALADIDFCEAHPTEAHAVNVELTRKLAALCITHNSRLVLCSTDTIFDGEHSPYDEDASPGPLNCYARTKVEAEAIVRELGNKGVIARLALVVGLPVLGAGNSFLARMLATLRAGRQLDVPVREVRTPVDVITVGRALLELAASDYSGAIHLAGNDSLGRLELAKRIASRFGLPPQLIVPADAANIARRAPRPRDVSLGNSRARTILRTPMLNLDEALTLITQNAHTATP